MKHSTHRTRTYPVGKVRAWFRSCQFMANLRHALEARIPLAYEDEAGFHFGVKENSADEQTPIAGSGGALVE